MLKKCFLILTSLSLITMVTFTTIVQEDLKLLKEQTFTVQSGGNLTVKAPAGNIKIISWDKSEANVKIYGNENVEGNIDFEVTQTGNDISVIGKAKDESKQSNLKAKFEIILPKQFNVEANTKGGNIDINDINGKIKVNTMGGNISLDKTEGEIDANTMGGNIGITTTNGKVSANTMGGNISLDYAGTNKGIDLNTMGGNIHAKLPADINGEADFSTSAGKITCDFAKPEKSYASSSLKAKFNDGGEAISINTSAGNINVEKK